MLVMVVQEAAVTRVVYSPFRRHEWQQEVP